ncbi:hypothetical protein [Sphingosinicella rhizophila]|uniref:Uncharacterized protein n=1 Tax=Sphingosinicella rhizophila TaxID=3050082 RepID=A0ABU3QA53_9SPHN|nr:hypothetical protein [Sphingosinicella sp. GR2756]MDT9600167.1 hypothetical protein [Sphingosinicella sp. GR2756]
MARSATDVMQDILYAAVVDALDALKGASKGVPNTLLRDIGAIHANSTFGDLPKELQAAITANVRSAFNRLLKEGYSVSHADAPPQRHAPPRHDVPRSGRPGGGPGKPGQRRPSGPDRPSGPGKPSGPRPPGGGGRPGASRPGGGRPSGGKPRGPGGGGR